MPQNKFCLIVLLALLALAVCTLPATSATAPAGEAVDVTVRSTQSTTGLRSKGA